MEPVNKVQHCQQVLLDSRSLSTLYCWFFCYQFYAEHIQNNIEHILDKVVETHSQDDN